MLSLLCYLEGLSARLLQTLLSTNSSSTITTSLSSPKVICSSESLAIFSYLVHSDNQAALIDPISDISSYIKTAEELKVRITKIFMTHYHADYLAGLNIPNTQVIMHGKKLASGQLVKDGLQIPVGSIKIKVLHTPGHTLQSSCYLALDKLGKPLSLFTGDTLFLGEVGRPDLAVKANQISSQQLADMLYQSLQKIKKLPDEVLVWPGHGKGSSCGKSISDGNFCTLGKQKANNYGLREVSSSEFVHDVLKHMPIPPSYFFNTAKNNFSCRLNFDQVFAKSFKSLALKDIGADAVFVNLFPLKALKIEHCKTERPCVYLQVCPDLQRFAGIVVPTNKSLVFIADSQEQARQVLSRMIIMGYTNIQGYMLKDGEAYKQINMKSSPIKQIDAAQFKKTYSKAQIIDVRNPDQIAQGSLQSSLKIQLTSLPAVLSSGQLAFDKAKEIVVHCRSGLRATYAATLLSSHGYQPVIVIDKVQNVLK